MIDYSEAMFRKALGTVVFAISLVVFHLTSPNEIIVAAAGFVLGDLIWYLLTRHQYGRRGQTY